MSAYQMGNLRAADLTRVLDPKTEPRRCGLTRFNTGGPTPDFHTTMDLTSHLRTYVECLYHHNDNWPDVESLPATTFMGRAIHVNIEGCEPNYKITGEDLEKVCGGRIKEGDIVIVDSLMKLVPFTLDSNTKKGKRPFICHEVTKWFQEKKVKCVDFNDGVSIESNNKDVRVFYDVLMEVNCVFLEALKNLEELATDTFFMSYSPPPIKGLDSCPIRVYAIEGLVKFPRQGVTHMKIVIIGARAVGSIYGGHLSLHNEVYLVDTNQFVVDQIDEPGLRLLESGQDVMYHLTAVTLTKGSGEMDLVVLFVKALFFKTTPNASRGITGLDAYVLTLQNGSGHENILPEFVDQEHIIIGTTEDNGAVLEASYVRYGGEGKTNVGMLTEDKNGMLLAVKASFDCCGFQVRIHENIQELTWDKLVANASLSAVAGVLQVKMGYTVANPYTWNLMFQLVREAVTVAGGLELTFDEGGVLEKVRITFRNNPEGITSICADIVTGRKTKVNTISGSAVHTAQKSGISAPTHEMIMNIIHVLEGKEMKTP